MTKGVVPFWRALLWMVPSWTALFLVLVVSSSRGETNESSSVKPEVILREAVPFYMQNALKMLGGMGKTEIESRILFAVSENCQKHTLELLSARLNKTSAPYIKALIDSWGKPSTESLNAESRKNAFGDYHQCLNVISPKTSSDNFQALDRFSGKYCVSVIRGKILVVNNETDKGSVEETISPFLFGSCLPSSCSKEDVVILASNTLAALNASEIDFGLLDCYVKYDDALDAWDIFIICILGILAMLALFSLLWDCGRIERKETVGSRFLSSFSLRQNVSSWLKTNDYEFAPSINGVLFLTVAWIILDNTWKLPFLSYYFPELYNLAPSMDYSDWSQLLIVNGHLAMDTLFTISGITISYKLMKELDQFDGKGGLYLYVQILMGFTPTYLLVVGIMATVFRFFADGPLSGLVRHASRNCESNGWKNVLYVNNFGNSTMENMCLPDSWYFAVEMQFLLIAPILLYILWKYRKTGFGILTLLILGSIAIPTILTYYQNMLPTAIPTRNYENYFMDFYILPWNRASPFLFGIACGYVLHNTGTRIKLSKGLVFAGWLLTTAVATSIIFGLFPYYNPTIKIPTIEAAIYAGFHRFAWGVSMSWIVFACTKGRGGWISTFLCWKFFSPLGKISMVAFLISLPVQFVHHFRIQPVLLSDIYTKVNLFIADLVITYFVAILLTLMLGIPFQRIGNFVKPREKDEEDDNLDGIEMKPKAKRYGIYYDTEISLCMDTSKGKTRRSPNTIKFYPRRQRYGIYYDNDISISMERIK